MADIGYELLPRALKLFEPSQIMKNEDGSVPLAVAVEDTRAVDLQPAFFWARQPELMLDGMIFSVQQVYKSR